MKHQILAAALLLSAAVSPAPAAAGTPATDNIEDVQARAAVEELIAQFEAEILAPGPVVAGWNAEGVDVEAEVAARPGGTAGNYLLETDKDGERSLVIYSPDSPTSVIPAGWTMIAEIGDFHQAGDLDLYAMHLDGPYFALIRAGSRQDGRAYCSDGPVQARLYQDPSVGDGSELDAAILEMIFQAIVRRFADKEICSRYAAQGDAYRARYFLPDGRSLPKMDEFEDKAVIVPSGDIRQLLIDGD